MTQEQRERKLRQEIHALRIKKFGWPLAGFKYMMTVLGFGDSLRALSEARLRELKTLMLNYRKHGRPNVYTYDKQGLYMFSLMKQAHWTDSDLRAFQIKHFKKSHWNLLSPSERKAVIAMFQNYINKANHNQHINNKEVSNGNESSQDTQK
jgi:hypothetical protein